MTEKNTKEKINVREVVNNYQANCDRIREIAEACEKEQRERNEKENAEYDALTRENQVYQMKLQVAAAENLRENPNNRADAVKMIRENAAHGRKTEIVFVREIMTVADVEGGAVIPLNIQDILGPLVEGFILEKVGLPMPTGLAGDFVWPMYEMIEATVLGEGAPLADSKIPFSKMTASPGRIGIAVPVTNETLNQTDGLLETIIRQIMPFSIRMLLNKILFSTEPVNEAARNAGLVGPFVEAVKTAVSLDNKPTFDQFNVNMKAKVLETGITGENLCWVMTKSMKAILEGTPVNKEGIFVPMVQNDNLAGLPIYTTNAIRKVVKSYKKYTSSQWKGHEYDEKHDTINYKVSGDSETKALATILKPSEGNIAEVSVFTEHVGLGDWRYQPMGLFGALRFIVDPYSQARKDAVDFVLNCNYGTKTLRQEAFVIGKVAASK